MRTKWLLAVRQAQDARQRLVIEGADDDGADLHGRSLQRDVLRGAAGFHVHVALRPRAPGRGARDDARDHEVRGRRFHPGLRATCGDGGRREVAPPHGHEIMRCGTVAPGAGRQPVHAHGNDVHFERVESAGRGGRPSAVGAVGHVLRGGQIVWFVPITEAWKETHALVADLSAPRHERVTAGRRSFDVVLEPDLEVGGWVVECPSLPGCVSEGSTLPEARRMIRDAIRGWLDVQSERSTATGPGRRRAR